MDTAIGLLGIAGFIICMLALAAGVTFGVVQLDARIRRRLGR
ncbi:MAG: hypothetical protein WD689_11030 [Gaiellaceae bacterium]